MSRAECTCDVEKAKGNGEHCSNCDLNRLDNGIETCNCYVSSHGETDYVSAYPNVLVEEYQKKTPPELPDVEIMSDISITIRIHGCMPTVVKFTNVPIAIVHEAIAHINDNSEPGN